MSWGIAYKPDPSKPDTMTGRLVGRGEEFETKELAEAFIADQGEDWFQAVEFSD